MKLNQSGFEYNSQIGVWNFPLSIRSAFDIVVTSRLCLKGIVNSKHDGPMWKETALFLLSDNQPHMNMDFTISLYEGTVT